MIEKLKYEGLDPTLRMDQRPPNDGASIGQRGVDYTSWFWTILAISSHKFGSSLRTFMVVLGESCPNISNLNTLVQMLGTSRINLNQHEHVKHAKAN